MANKSREQSTSRKDTQKKTERSSERPVGPKHTTQEEKTRKPHPSTEGGMDDDTRRVDIDIEEEEDDIRGNI